MERTSALDVEALATIAVDAAVRTHRELGPGLLESVYVAVLSQRLRARGLAVRREVVVPIVVGDERIPEAFRADLIVEGRLLIEVKSLEHEAPVHRRQVLTYLRLPNLTLGLLMNFGAPTMKQGLRRIVNQHPEGRGSPLRIQRASAGSDAEPR